MKIESSGKFDFVGRINLFGGISVLFVVISLLYLGIKGIRYGIDFVGGTEVQVQFEGAPVGIDTVRTMANQPGILDLNVQSIGDKNEYIIRFQTTHGKTDKETNDNQNLAVTKLKESLLSYQSAKADIRRVDSVGPQVGAELKRNGILAVFYSLLVILIYVALRFDYKYSPGAVVCLFHDAIITLFIFVLVGKDVNIPILAAILTLIGYSLNDTIVVFDRIRETEGHYKDKGMKFIINRAINDMFGRTLITSGTTFVAAFCLYLFAGGTVSDIAFAICVGILFGTYSSIYVAAPLILLIEKITAKSAA